MALLDQIPAAKTISPARHAVLDYGVVATFVGMGLRFRGRNNRAAALAFINAGMVLGVSMATDYPGGVLTGLAGRAFNRPVLRTAIFATVVLASHGLLDTMTDGGLGAALLWPFSLTRYFAPWRPIPVAPIGPDFFSADGATIALIELILFLPLFLFALRVGLRAVDRKSTRLNSSH